MLDTGSKHLPNFIRIWVPSMKTSYFKNTNELLRTKLYNSPPDFIFSIYIHQVIDVIESKICKFFPSEPKKKSPENVWSILFENKGVEYLTLARILGNPNRVNFLPTSSVEFPVLRVTYTNWLHLYLLSSTIFSRFANNLVLVLFLTNPLPRKFNNSPFADRHIQHIRTGDLRKSLKIMF